MVVSKEAREITEMTAEEVVQALTVEYALEGVGIVAEIPKSPRTLRPKKDKQLMILVHVSPQNLLRTRLTMEENGKAVDLETNKEEEDIEDLIIEEDKDEGLEIETEISHPPTKFPSYVPLWKGKAKVPKDLDESKSSLQTPLLPNDIIFEGTHLGRVLNLKF